MRRLAVVGALAALAVLVTVAGARAHASLRSSDPRDGASLDRAPTAITMTFTERPDPTLSSIQVLDASGSALRVGSLTSVPGAPTSLRASFPGDAPDGVYTVTWRAVSAVDGHFTTGTFTFGIGEAPPATTGTTAATVAPPPSVASIVGRVLLYVGFAILFAIAVVGTTSFRGSPPARGPLLAIGAAATLVGAVTMTVAERSSAGTGYATLLRSSAGRPFLVLLAGAASCALGALAHARRPDAASAAVLGIVTAAAMLARAWGGHAAATGVVPYRVGLQWLHLMGAAVWIGAVLLLVVALAGRAAESLDDVALGVSRWALIGLGVVAVTGVLRSLEELGVRGWLHAFSSSYGTVLVLKLGAGVLLIGLGAVNRFRSIPRLRSGGGRRLLRRVATTELVLAPGVFVLTGILTGLAPPTTATASSRPPLTVTGHDFATTTRVRLVVDPGTAGRNDFTATITDYDSGAPVPADHVSLRFIPAARPDVAPGSLPLTKGPDGTWTGVGSQLPLDGTWDVSVQITESARTTIVPLTVTTRPPPERITVSRAAGQPDITTITLPSGISVQSYADPGTAGANELHYTAFDAKGTELPIVSVTLAATSPSGATRTLEPRRLSSGHFVFDATLTAGRWRFDAVARAKDGSSLRVVWGVTVG